MTNPKQSKKKARPADAVLSVRITPPKNVTVINETLSSVELRQGPKSIDITVKAYGTTISEAADKAWNTFTDLKEKVKKYDE